MNQEDLNQMNSNSGGSGNGGLSRSSKKQKQKKIPQRGLGVAQLEKIRIEEQQKKEAAVSPTLTPVKSPTLAASNIVNYPSNQLSPSSSSVPYPPPPPPLPPSPATISSSHSNGDYNTVLRPPPSMPSIDGFHLNSVPSLTPSSVGSFDLGWPSIPPPPLPLYGNSQFPKLWNPYEMNHTDVENNNLRLDQQGPASGLNMSLPQENSPVGPLPDIMHRVQHFQQSSAASLVNVPLNSSPIFDFQIEPPSNQNCFSNYSSLWPDEDKMVYMKRPYPFPLDCPAIPSLHTKLPRVSHPMSASDESTSCRNGSSNINLEPPVPIFRARVPETIPKKSHNKENGHSNGDFLSLAPPSVIPSSSSPRFKHSQPNGNGQDPGDKLGTGQGGPNHHQQPLFSFMPSAKQQNGFVGANNYENSSNNSEVRDSVDLNLKL